MLSAIAKLRASIMFLVITILVHAQVALWIRHLQPHHASFPLRRLPTTKGCRCRALVALMPFTAMGMAYAQQAGDPLGDLTTFICSIVATLSGGFGIALSLAVLAIGLLPLAVGARGAMSRLGIGVVAIAGLVSLPTLFTSMFPAAAGSMCPTF
jgi:hypothetical protein